MHAPRAVVSAALHTRLGCDKTAGARPVVVRASPQTARASALGQSSVRGRNLTGKGCNVCAGVRNLGSFALDDVFRRRKIRAQGFMLLDDGSMHGLDPFNNSLSDRIGQSLLELVPRELSRTLLRLLLTLHGFGNAHVIELDESLHHSWQLCTHGILVTDQLVNRVRRSGTLLLLELL